jgi:fructokinase
MSINDRRVFCIGETVLDIIFIENRPVAANPGGSMLNSAVSLGRAGIPVYFISDFAEDLAGNLVQSFLLQNNVSTEFVSIYKGGKTSLALAFLNEERDAQYSFYKIFPEERLTADLPIVNAGDIILFGSFYALTASLRVKITTFIGQARQTGAFIIYDPNFRTAHLEELEALRPWIIENIGIADMVRGSDEDFLHIFASADANQAFQEVKHAGCQLLVYTRNSKSVELRSAGYSRSFDVPFLSPVSTVGAGDAFNAGIIYALMHQLTNSEGIAASSWEDIIGYAIRFAADVCTSIDNHIRPEFAQQLTNKH